MCIRLTHFVQDGSLVIFSWRNSLPILNTRESTGMNLDGVFPPNTFNPKTLFQVFE